MLQEIKKSYKNIVVFRRPKEDDSYGPGFKKDIASSQLETDISKVG